MGKDLKNKFINYESFNRYPKIYPSDVINITWKEQLEKIKTLSNFLPRGYGKSYGDSCLIDNGTLVDTTELNHLISFDKENLIIEAEAGAKFSKLLDFMVPNKAFLPVTPGTKYISLAGAIANDVHGKNHHKGGTFGRHTLEFELVRSNGEVLTCSPEQNSDLYKATIGGLGLTGVITKAKFKAIAINNPYLYVENIKYKNLDEFFEINEESVKDYNYTVSWIDSTAKGKSLGRGIYNRGNFTNPNLHKVPENDQEQKMLPFPLDYPFINNLSVKAFNLMWYKKQVKRHEKVISHYNPFFYPLDGVDGWNKSYGKNGFLQYQFVIPLEKGRKILPKILSDISKSGLSSFLVVLKTFGDLPSPGMLSFPEPGITLAIDFRMDGEKTLKLLDKLDEYIIELGGRLYPAKDARMKAEHFKKFYPNWQEFLKYKDPNITSAFWERVMG